MKTYNREIELPEGKFNVEVIQYDKSDDQLLRAIYDEWRSLSNKLISLKGRGINLPDVLSEASFCRHFDAENTIRVNSGIAGANSSFDAYNIKTKKRIQIKACSVLPDLTSFGPDSVWDDLYFLDFYRNGQWDRTFDIYQIPNKLIYSFKVNKLQTMHDQQKQKRRPRFSIFEGIIKRENISPIKTCRL